MKPRRIKIWPNITYISPGTLYFQPLKKKDREIILDFTNCRSVNSTGLTILLIRILKMVNQDDRRRSWMIELPNNEKVLDRMLKLGFFKILNQFIENKDLFWPDKLINDKSKTIEFQGQNLEQLLSIPIYTLKFNNCNNRREVLSELKRWLLKQLTQYSKGFDIQINQVILILNEIIKNSADHTSENCYMGLDFITSNDRNMKICFAVGDLGKGIMQNVRDYLHETDQARAKYFSIDEMYKWALQFGNTTQKESENNAGVGMPTIVEGSKPIELQLFVFDGESCGYLNNIESLSYSRLRKNFYHIGHNVGFYYYCEILLNTK